jgi:hypothetical protein
MASIIRPTHNPPSAQYPIPLSLSNTIFAKPAAATQNNTGRNPKNIPNIKHSIFLTTLASALR